MNEGRKPIDFGGPAAKPPPKGQPGRKPRLGAGMEDVMEGIGNPVPSLSAEVSIGERHRTVQFIVAQNHAHYLDSFSMALEGASETNFNRSIVIRAIIEGLQKAKPDPETDLVTFMGVNTEQQLAERFRILFKESITA